MPFNVGDVVRVAGNISANRGAARIQRVLPRTLSVQDFQEYIVEFVDFRSERFRFGLCREFELKPDRSAETPGKASPCEG
jgi:hypothetical protein